MKVNTVGKTLLDVRRAYLAGLMDGDGSIMACIEPHKEKKFKFRIRVVVKITLSSESDIRWIRNLTGIGRIRKNRRTFEWIVRDKNELRWILEIIKPYLYGKKKQCNIALKILDKNPSSLEDIKCNAYLADKLSSYNIRSKDRRKNYASIIKNVSRND